MSISDRLKRILSQKKISQAQLAEELDVSAASVSSWCSGSKRPSTDKLVKIAAFLDVSPGYLNFGDGSADEEPPEILKADRKKYRKELEWYWRPPHRDRGRDYGNAAAYAFETDVTSLGRESGQNISDERLSTAPTVEARYTVIELSGKHLQDFLKAIKFDDIRPHLEAAMSVNKKAGTVIQRGLRELEEDARMIFIRVEDFDANGLTGPEYDTGRYMAVVRNLLDSQKGETAGGSFGLGWATFPASSQFGLVLCNSVLSVAEGDQTEDRFIGVIDLPWHSIDGEEYAGRGWYGLEDPNDTGERPKPTVSYWGNRALTLDTMVNRSDRRPGTSFLIVGAYDPSGEATGSEGIASRLAASLADNFWPAMVDHPDGSARLQVIVRAERNGRPLSEVYINPAEFQSAKVDAFRKHLLDDLVDSLENVGDVVRRDVTLHVPRRVAEPKHDPYTHNAVLLVSQADGVDSGSTAPGTITLVRGSHMVICSPRLTALPIGARTFHAIVLAGEAAGADAADRAADRFLRAAEPPAHNKWTGTSEITTSYKRGGKAFIERFLADIKKAVREIIRQSSSDLSDGPESLKELLRIVPPKPAGKRPQVKSVRNHEIDASGAWVVTEAKITLPARKDNRGWTIQPVLRFGTESGATIPVKWANIDAVARCTLDDHGRLVTLASARTAVFSAITAPGSHPVAAKRALVHVDVRVFPND